MRAQVDIVHEAFQKWGLHMNVLKTKIMKLKYNHCMILYGIFLPKTD